MASLRSLVCLLFLGLLTAGPALAQDPSSLPQVSVYARPGQATMLVYVWGSVGQAGPWRVERGVDLVELLSVVQVPGIGLEEPGTKSTAYVAIYRPQGGDRREVYREKITDLLQEGARYPALQDNDIVAVEINRRRTVGFQLVSTIVGTASSLTLLILNLTGN